MSTLKLNADGITEATRTSVHDVYVELPMQFYTKVTQRYRAQLVYIPDATITSMALPLAVEKDVVGYATAIPYRLYSYNPTDTAALGLNGTPVVGTESLSIPSASIPLILANTGTTQVRPLVTISGLNVSITPGWYWVVFDFGAQPCVLSTTKGWAACGCGPGSGGTFYITQNDDTLPPNTADPAFNPSPTRGATQTVWGIVDTTSDMLLTINGTGYTDIRVSLDRTHWTDWESLYNFTAGAWQLTMKRVVDLWDANIGGTYDRGQRYVYVQLRRISDVTETWEEGMYVTSGGVTSYINGLPIDYVGGTPVIRGLHIYYRTIN